MSDEWRADLRLKLEDLVDKCVVNGADHEAVLKAIGEEVGNLRQARERDPDPADDRVIDEPASDWPSAT